MSLLLNFIGTLRDMGQEWLLQGQTGNLGKSAWGLYKGARTRSCGGSRKWNFLSEGEGGAPRLRPLWGTLVCLQGAAEKHCSVSDDRHPGLGPGGR